MSKIFEGGRGEDSASWASIVTGNVDFRIRAACKDQSDLARVIEGLRGARRGSRDKQH